MDRGRQCISVSLRDILFLFSWDWTCGADDDWRAFDRCNDIEKLGEVKYGYYQT